MDINFTINKYSLFSLLTASQNGMSSVMNTESSSQLDQCKQETDNEHDSETTSQISTTLLDISNLVGNHIFKVVVHISRLMTIIMFISNNICNNHLEASPLTYIQYNFN